MKPEKEAPMALLVSDDDKVAPHIKAVFDKLGFDTVVALDAVHAAQEIARRAPHFVCTDLILPRGSGLEVCQLIREDPSLQGVPIMVMNEHGLPEEIAFAEEAGADAFLARPFSMDEFRDQVQATLEHVPSSSHTAWKLEGAKRPGEEP